MVTSQQYDLSGLLGAAFQKRLPLIEGTHTQALRLFNGYTEGVPDVVIDLFGQTLVLCSHSSDVAAAKLVLTEARTFLLEKLPWLTCALEKYRASSDEKLRKGTLTFGSHLEKQITENGIQYALDLRLNQDASFYMDTRLSAPMDHCSRRGEDGV